MLVICCEEGVEEYEEEVLDGNAVLVTVESPEEPSPPISSNSCSASTAEADFIFEYNGMWKIEKLLEVPPENWPVVQTFTMIDASTFEMYLSNMRSIMMELVKLSDGDLQPLH